MRVSAASRACLLLTALCAVACDAAGVIEGTPDTAGEVDPTAPDAGSVSGLDDGFDLQALNGRAPKRCGNGVCSGRETCDNCPADCGSCDVELCGNNLCGAGEDCASCATDCGACGPTCGDGTCADEDCMTCPADCGECPPACGDGTCASDEDCSSCSADCGVCPPVCGDATCEGNAGEMCTTCASDCDTLSVVCGNGACETGETSASCYGDCGPATWPTDWASFEDQVVVLMNQHRAAGTDCPTTAQAPVGPVTVNSALRTASRLHSWDESWSNYFAHDSCNGRSPWDRARAQGIDAYGEILGAGHTTPAAIVQGWLTSQGHCAILMSGSYTQVGVGYAAPKGRMWGAMFR